jgi:hypothetical protein
MQDRERTGKFRSLIQDMAFSLSEIDKKIEMPKIDFIRSFNLRNRVFKTEIKRFLLFPDEVVHM